MRALMIGLTLATSACTSVATIGELGGESPFFQSAFYTVHPLEGRFGSVHVQLDSFKQGCETWTDLAVAEVAFTDGPVDANAAFAEGTWAEQLPQSFWQLMLTLSMPDPSRVPATQDGLAYTLDGEQATAVIAAWHTRPTEAYFTGTAPDSDFRFDWSATSNGKLTLVRTNADAGQLKGALTGTFLRAADDAVGDVALGFTAQRCTSLEDVIGL